MNQETNVQEKEARVRQPWTAQRVGDILLNNALLIIMAIAVVYIAIKNPNFIKPASLINILSQTAAYLPAALGIGGCIVLTGTDISAGRCVGLTACVAASLLQMSGYANKMFKDLDTMPLIVVLLAVMAIGAVVGLVNGFFVAKFKLHPFIVTLSTQLIVFGTVLMYLMIGGNNGQTLSGLDQSYTKFITGTLFSVDGVAIPKYVLYSIILTAIMWVVWNKTKFGKNMFAAGSAAQSRRENFRRPHSGNGHHGGRRPRLAASSSRSGVLRRAFRWPATPVFQTRCRYAERRGHTQFRGTDESGY